MKCLTIAYVFIGLASVPIFAKPFKIIAQSDPKITTHEISSGEYIIGVTENGGGVINKVF